ncbi:hypothetical protein [Chryseobacterium indoltheticum]|uniref:hypothetical protein n=1 Tax=Chryseobacterium indoltheticum TaxID=254 RepID=UPI0011C04885|nr:hypothetical protein [Chryseobacterium indoltheticum]
MQKKSIEKFLIHRQNLCFHSRVLDTFFYAALRKTLELTKPFSYRVNKTSLRVGFEENRIEKFLIEDKICASIHWFSIHFSALRYEKHSN